MIYMAMILATYYLPLQVGVIIYIYASLIISYPQYQAIKGHSATKVTCPSSGLDSTLIGFLSLGLTSCHSCWLVVRLVQFNTLAVQLTQGNLKFLTVLSKLIIVCAYIRRKLILVSSCCGFWRYN